MQHAVIAILSGPEQSVRCADALKQAGFTRDEISVLLPDDFGAQELGFERRTKAAEGVAVGMTSGFLAGFFLGFCAAEMHVNLPGLQFIFSSGQIIAALCMASIMAAIVGFLGGLIGATLPQYVTRKYDRKTRLGNSLMSVHVSSAAETKIAEKILRNEGAQDVQIADEKSDRRKPPQFVMR